MTTPNITTPSDTSVQPGGAPNSITGMSVSPYANIGYPQQETRYFTEADLERARQQEKDKLYERLERTTAQMNEFKSTVDSLMADKKARDDELTKQQQAAEAEAKRLRDEKLSVQELLERQQTDFQTQQEKLQADWDRKLATMEMENKYQALKAYIQRRINEEINATTIIPDLAEYITGDNEEQVEASIKKAQEKTAAIVNAAMGSNPAPSFPMGTSPTGAPFSPLDNLSPANRQLTREQIANMSMRDYAEYRRQAGMDRAGSGHGLFS
jgi:DNA repair exonuclease SbcCD ATPase subunit